MTHAITLGDLLLCLAALGGGVAAAWGFLMFMAAGMSDAPADDLGKQGCITFVIGAVVMVGSLVWLLS